MSKHFSSDFFTNNRRQLRDLVPSDQPIALSANGLLQRNGDTFFAFRQDSNFWYLTGIEEPDVVLVMDSGGDFLILPELDPVKKIFDGDIDAELIKSDSGIEQVYSQAEGWRKLGALLAKTKQVATLSAPEPYLKQLGFYTNPARAALCDRIRQENSAIEMVHINEHLARLRMVKQPPELKAIQSAIDITAKTIETLRERDYQFEYEAEADITAGFRRLGAKGHGFLPIVASGKRACVLHQIANQGAIKNDELLLVDIGAEVSNYSADITRTLSLNQRPSARQQQVFEAVVKVQDYALSLIKPGVSLRKYEKQVERFMGEQLKSLGLIKTAQKGSVRTYYPHATSHFLGLDVHDVADYKMPLQAGCVITVEPGIYIPEEGIGIRIEDDVLLTETGNRVLSKNLPRDLH